MIRQTHVSAQYSLSGNLAEGLHDSFGFSQPHHTEFHHRDLALESGQSGCPRKFKFFTKLWKLLEDFLL